MSPYKDVIKLRVDAELSQVATELGSRVCVWVNIWLEPRTSHWCMVTQFLFRFLWCSKCLFSSV